jgi:hypothetical protein
VRLWSELPPVELEIELAKLGIKVRDLLAAAAHDPEVVPPLLLELLFALPPAVECLAALAFLNPVDPPARSRFRPVFEKTEAVLAIDPDSNHSQPRCCQDGRPQE